MLPFSFSIFNFNYYLLSFTSKTHEHKDTYMHPRWDTLFLFLFLSVSLWPCLFSVPRLICQPSPGEQTVLCSPLTHSQSPGSLGTNHDHKKKQKNGWGVGWGAQDQKAIYVGNQATNCISIFTFNAFCFSFFSNSCFDCFGWSCFPVLKLTAYPDRSSITQLDSCWGFIGCTRTLGQICSRGSYCLDSSVQLPKTKWLRCWDPGFPRWPPIWKKSVKIIYAHLYTVYVITVC